MDLRALLAEALARGGGGHTLADVLAAVDRGEAQVWRAPAAVLVTEIAVTPRMKELHFWLAGGELEPVLALADAAIAWGREQGCTAATMTGRRGWEKVLAKRGWTTRLTTMGKAI